MDVTEFHRLADDALVYIAETFEDSEAGEVAEVDYENNVVTIEFDDGRTYVLNKHEAMRQIWVSSPKSGGLHFSYDTNHTQWLTSDKQELLALLSNELGVEF